MEQDSENANDLDTSHDLGLVTLYTATTFDSEVEADVLKSLMEANGIPARVIGSPFPNLGYQIQAPRDRAEEARCVLEEARAAGPEAASEAESESEKGDAAPRFHRKAAEGAEEARRNT